MLARALVLLSAVPIVLLACTGTSGVSIPEPTTDTATNDPGPEGDALPIGSAIAHEDASQPDAGADAAPVLPACDVEIEPNDAADTATPLTTCLSGVLATSKDRDYWTVTAPAAATSMQITHAETGGMIAYRVYATTPFGNLFPTTFTGAAPAIAVTGGTTYIVRLTASGAASVDPRSYRADVAFE